MIKEQRQEILRKKKEKTEYSDHTGAACSSCWDRRVARDTGVYRGKGSRCGE